MQLTIIIIIIVIIIIVVIIIAGYWGDFPSTPTIPATLHPVNQYTPMLRFAWSHSPLYTLHTKYLAIQ